MSMQLHLFCTASPMAVVICFAMAACGSREGNVDTDLHDSSHPGTDTLDHADSTPDTDSADAPDDSEHSDDSDAPVDTDTENGVVLDWVRISSGLFSMGNEDDLNASPVREVTVQIFYITRTEITVEQYAHCVSDTVCSWPSTTEPEHNFGKAGRERHPVNGVTFQQAEAFCAWVGGTLPSEARWEYAARSEGLDHPYPWGTADVDCDRAAIWGCTSEQALSDEVCGHLAGNTVQGLCDMAGNVYEWLADDWAENHEGAPSNDLPRQDEPDDAEAVVRGGGFLSQTDNGYLETTSRRGYLKNLEEIDLGFRCARDVEPDTDSSS